MHIVLNARIWIAQIHVCIFLCFRKATTEPTYFTCETTVNQMNRSFLQATEGRSTPLGLESACTVSVLN